MLWQAAGAYGAGLLLADLDPALAWALAPRCAGIGLAVYWVGRRRSRLRLVALWIAFVSCGAAALAGALAQARENPIEAPRDLTLEARICGHGGRLDRPWVDLCQSVDVGDPRAGLPARIRLHPPHGPVHHGGARFDDLVGGQRMRAAVRLRPLRRASNPGEADRRSQLQRQGIGAQAVLADSRLLIRIAEPKSEARSGFETSVRRFRSARRAVSQRLAAAGEAGGLVRALVLGDRGGLTSTTRSAFAQLGIAHLLAVSGLHVAMVAGLAFFPLLAVLRRWQGLASRVDVRRGALFGALLIAVGYGAVAGWGIPVRRALLFLGVLAVTHGLRREVRPLNALALAALLLLVAEPHALFALSAQLSFAATAALLLSVPRDEVHGGMPGREFGGLLHTTATAMLATTPILAAHGLSAGLAGLLANAAAVPWSTFVLLPACLVAAAGAWVSDIGVGSWVFEAAIAPARITLIAVDALARALPALPARPAPAGIFLVVAAGVAVLALRRGSTVWRMAACAGISVALAFTPTPQIAPRPPRVVVFDVGQGDAIVVQGERAAMLVDGGRRIEGRFDQGERIVLPGLRALGIPRLDVVVATHADLDHRGGLEVVLRRVPTDELWLPAGSEDERGFDRLRSIAAARGVAVREVAAGGAARRIGDISIEVLWPPRSDRFGRRNDDSIVLRGRFAAQSTPSARFLLTADIGRATEARLLAAGVDVAADLLKLAHHGSRGSSTSVWLDAVAAGDAVVSAPCQGRGGLPSDEALARLAASGARRWWTGEVGAVFVGFSPRSERMMIRGWHPPERCSIPSSAK